MHLTTFNRYQATLIHIAISLIIFIALLLFITQAWYPGILFDTGNGWKAISMIVGIDIILGPLLTLLVFNPKKKSLKFDLAVIALLQTAALIYGTWVIQQTRPVAIAFINTHFVTIYANSLLGGKLKDKAEALKTYELYYNFDDNKPSSSLLTEQFESYSQHALAVKNLSSPYRTNNLINIDPLMSLQRFIQIDDKTGSIVGFIKKQQE